MPDSFFPFPAGVKNGRWYAFYVTWLLRRQSLSSLPATKRLPHHGGLVHLLISIVVGSVIRDAENCLRRLSSTSKIPSAEIRPERQVCLPSFGKDCTFWCVIGLFQIGSTVQLPVGMEGKTSPMGMFVLRCGKNPLACY